MENKKNYLASVAARMSLGPGINASIKKNKLARSEALTVVG